MCIYLVAAMTGDGTRGLTASAELSAAEWRTRAAGDMRALAALMAAAAGDESRNGLDKNKPDESNSQEMFYQIFNHGIIGGCLGHWEGSGGRTESNGVATDVCDAR